MSDFPPGFVPGWSDNDDAVCLEMERIAQSGGQPIYRQAVPVSRGERPLIVADWLVDGQDLSADPWYQPRHQTRGTCVSQAVAGAVQSCLLDLHWRTLVWELKAPVASEPIYGHSRVEIGKRAIRGEGSVVAWAVRSVCEFVVLRRKYGKIDLTNEDDELAARWGNSGCPDSLEDAGQRHHMRTAAVVDTVDSLLDAIYSRHWVARGASHCHTGDRDKFGQCRIGQYGPHAQQICGAYTDQDGDQSVIYRQSWGPDMPGGPAEIVLRDKTRVKVPAGCYGVKADYVAKEMASNDWWALSGPNGWAQRTTDFGGAV